MPPPWSRNSHWAYTVALQRRKFLYIWLSKLKIKIQKCQINWSFYLLYVLGIVNSNIINYISFNIIRLIKSNGYLVAKFKCSRRLFASALGSWWRLRCSDTGSLFSFHATSSISGETEGLLDTPNSKIEEASKSTWNYMECVWATETSSTPKSTLA